MSKKIKNKNTIKTKKTRSRKLEGFSLAEIMIAVLILTIVAVMVVPNLVGQAEEARRKTAKVNISQGIATALDAYEMDCGRFPTTDQGLIALLETPTKAPDARRTTDRSPRRAWPGGGRSRRRVR